MESYNNSRRYSEEKSFLHKWVQKFLRIKWQLRATTKESDELRQSSKMVSLKLVLASKSIGNLDFENIGKAGQSKSTSAFAFRRNRGITTGLSMIGTPLMSPSKSDRTPLAGYNKPKGASPLRPSIMVESGDEKHDFNFPSLICKQSKPHIEDISSLRTFLGTVSKRLL